MPEFQDRSEDRSDAKRIGPDHQLAAPPPSSKGWILWVTLLVVAAVVAFYFLHGNKAKTAKTADGGATAAAGAGGGRRGGMTGPVPVTVAKAKKGDLGVYLDGLGTVTPVYTATITPQAGGVITQVNYREGQYVKKGDLLIEIDPRPYQATLLQAQGALEKDTNVLAQAQMDLERYKAAWARNAINKQLLEDQEKIVLQDQGTVKNDQGTVDYDQVQLSYCRIVAPISGQTGLRLVDPGNVVTANSTSPLVVITQMQPTTIIFPLAEDSLGQVEARMRQVHTLPVEAWDRGQTNKLADGKLQTINNQIDTTTGTVKLRAMFENKNTALWPNQFVNAHLLVNTQSGVTIIPTGAVQHNGDQAFVYVITPPPASENGVNGAANGAQSAPASGSSGNSHGSGKGANGAAAGGGPTGSAKMQNVKTGVTDGGMVAVEGINPGDLVATSSFEKLQDGAKVNITKAVQAASPAGGETP